MITLRTFLTVAATLAATSLPAFAQDAAAADPSGTYVDQWGTTFTFSLCGSGTDLCATLDVLKGDSANEENLAFVGKQVIQAQQTEPNTWKGSIEAGGLSAKATITQTSASTLDIAGCKAIICNTITYTRQ